ncbi:hypothetical protein P152DRAFT_433605 [Eremomyces bilateralis CBS 781.70]|uniref:Defect at low temperature protein 1 n=1 Tax=Eremomyces bilateralis CBS 781.70 TaxID=1392243 RepID=A0A6G1G7Y6_9PEZI|nr:uncharacterized protein P152DRAFT_433605 [Eremomyces bilateralis CBS 781.70]KAF1813969.1 hypothetical protein P152DRAFT_433605 [Eremomyces bilateralis CBS 781.70]
MRFPHIRLPRIPFFRIWYSTTYTLLFFVIFVLSAVIPGDLIYQSIRKPPSLSRFNTNIANIFIVAGVYLLTGLLIVFIYASRLYTNRIVLTAIPKFYIPVEAPEVGKKVRKLIEREWDRSALIAWESRPRDLAAENDALHPSATHDTTEEIPHHALPVMRKRTRTKGRDSPAMPIDPLNPPWGIISHPGWDTADTTLGNVADLVSYGTVIAELPNLIEARAVSLAPVDPMPVPQLDSDDNAPNIPVSRVVALLQRSETAGLREYLMQLEGLGVVQSFDMAEEFIGRYERARFSTIPASKDEFDELMVVFAELLNGMEPIDLGLADEMLAFQDQTMHGIGSSDTYEASSTPDGSVFRSAMLAQEEDDGSVGGNASLSSVIRNTGTETR